MFKCLKWRIGNLINVCFGTISVANHLPICTFTHLTLIIGGYIRLHFLGVNTQIPTTEIILTLEWSITVHPIPTYSFNRTHIREHKNMYRNHLPLNLHNNELKCWVMFLNWNLREQYDNCHLVTSLLVFSNVSIDLWRVSVRLLWALADHVDLLFNIHYTSF